MKRLLFISTILTLVFRAVSAVVITTEGDWSYTLTGNQNGAATEVFTVYVPDNYRADVRVTGRYSIGNTESSTTYVSYGDAILGGFDSRWDTSYDISFKERGSFTLFASATPDYYQTRKGLKPYSNYYCKLSYVVSVRFTSLLPDLKVTASDLSISPLAELPTDVRGELVAVVRNVGTAPSAQTTAKVYADGALVASTLEVPAMGAGSSKTLRQTLPALSAGIHKIMIKVNPDGAVQESSVNNNEAETSFRTYARTPYSVRFDANGGSGTMSAQAHVCGTFAALTANGFTGPKSFDGVARNFAGWAKTASGPVAYANRAVVTNLTFTSGGVVNLYAVWKARFYVMYDGNGGYCDSAPFKCEEGGRVTLTTKMPVRDGYEFKGWALTRTGTVRYAAGATVTDLSAPEGGTVALYAVWSQLMTGRSQADPWWSVYTTYLESRPVGGTIGDLPGTSTSDCWYSDAEGGVSVTSSSRIISSQSLYCFSVREKAVVSFDANGGSGRMSDLEVWSGKDTYCFPACTFTRAGYHFIGWHYDKATADKGTYAYCDGAECPASERTYYAVWEKDWSTINRFDANGGTGTMSDQIVMNGAADDLPECTFAHPTLSFVGWERDWKKSDGSNTVWKAVWGKELKPADGRYRGDVKFITSASYTTAFSSFSPVPTLSEYDLWHLVETTDGTFFQCSDIQLMTCGTLSVSHVESDDPESAMDHWCSYRYRYRTQMHQKDATPDHVRTHSRSVTVSTYQNSWKSVEDEWSGNLNFSFTRHSLYASQYYGASATYDSLAKTSGPFLMVDFLFFMPLAYTLDGRGGSRSIDLSPSSDWTATSSASWLAVGRDASNGCRASITYLANDSIDTRTATAVTSDGNTITFTQSPGLTPVELRLLPEGGLLPGTNIVRVAAENAVGSALPTPARRGYVFLGWYTAKTGGSSVTASSRMTADALLYARWKAATYTVCFNANGGTASKSSMTVSFGTAIGALPTATRAGYAFLGWVYNGVILDETTQLAGNLTVEARWQETSFASVSVPSWMYRIVFQPNGGTGDGISPAYVLRNRVTALPKCSLRLPGKRFAGWRCSNGRCYDDGMLVFNIAKPGETVTMTAIWE